MQHGDVISYLEMFSCEGSSLEGMNYRLGPSHPIVLMSVRPGAPYEYRVEDDGKTLIYEGPDIPKSPDVRDPKTVDNPPLTGNGSPTQNGLFYRASEAFRNGVAPPEAFVSTRRSNRASRCTPGSSTCLKPGKSHPGLGVCASSS
jgi:hypothetical protein